MVTGAGTDTERESNLQNAFRDAFRLAAGKLALLEPDDVCVNSGAVYDRVSSLYKLKYIDRYYLFSTLSGAFISVDNEGIHKPTDTEGVLMLHYMVNARRAGITGKKISFREIPGAGNIYYPVFQKRAVKPLVNEFSGNPELLKKAAAGIGGRCESFGSACVVVDVLPYVPVTYIVWQGDDEVEPSGTILFDSSVTSFLTGEDAVFAASFGAYRLIGASRTMSGAGNGECEL